MRSHSPTDGFSNELSTVISNCCFRYRLHLAILVEVEISGMQSVDFRVWLDLVDANSRMEADFPRPTSNDVDCLFSTIRIWSLPA